MQILLLGLAFLLELVAFAAFAFSATLLSIDSSLQVILGIALLIVLIAFWSTFMAPKAPKKFTLLPYYLSKSAIYFIAALVLFKKMNSEVGIFFVLLAVLDEVFLFKHNTK